MVPRYGRKSHTAVAVSMTIDKKGVVPMDGGGADEHGGGEGGGKSARLHVKRHWERSAVTTSTLCRSPCFLNFLFQYIFFLKIGSLRNKDWFPVPIDGVFKALHYMVVCVTGGTRKRAGCKPRTEGVQGTTQASGVTFCVFYDQCAV